MTSVETTAALIPLEHQTPNECPYTERSSECEMPTKPDEKFERERKRREGGRRCNTAFLAPCWVVELCAVEIVFSDGHTAAALLLRGDEGREPKVKMRKRKNLREKY